MTVKYINSNFWNFIFFVRPTLSRGSERWPLNGKGKYVQNL
jgi:hypothetical protein